MFQEAALAARIVSSRKHFGITIPRLFAGAEPNPYGGEIALPNQVIASAHSSGNGLRFGNGFLRVSKLTAAGLFGSQFVQAGRRRNVRALLRLPLLPPLAVSALVVHGLTGNDKGIW